MSWFTRVYRLAHAAMQSGSNVKERRSINPLKLLTQFIYILAADIYLSAAEIL